MGSNQDKRTLPQNRISNHVKSNRFFGSNTQSDKIIFRDEIRPGETKNSAKIQNRNFPYDKKCHSETLRGDAMGHCVFS